MTSETLFDIVMIIRHERPANVEEGTHERRTGGEGGDPIYTRRLMFALNHSRPSYKPSPLVAQAAYFTGKNVMTRSATQPLDYRRKIVVPYLDIPESVPQAVEPELVGDLRGVHSVRQVLLVGEDEQHRIPELILVQHPLQLLTRLRHTITVVRVDDEDDALGVLEVCW